MLVIGPKYFTHNSTCVISGEGQSPGTKCKGDVSLNGFVLPPPLPEEEYPLPPLKETLTYSEMHSEKLSKFVI